MSRYAAFPRVPEPTAYPPQQVAQINHPARLPADDLVQLRMDILRTVCASPGITARMNWQDLPELLGKLEAQITRRD